jgi:segregation and condensation protein B
MRFSNSPRWDLGGAKQNRSRTPAVALGSRATRFLHPLADLVAPARSSADEAKSSGAPANSLFRRSARLRRLESVLFLSREPISARRLSQFADLADAGEARTLVRRLNAFYDTAGRAFRVDEAAGGYLLQTRSRFANWIRRCPQTPREMRLSAPTLETLTVIAYRQPVARSEIEAIRGVNCGEILRQLLDRDLVRIAGRSDELGRPYLYETTPRFLQAFGLKRIEDLPALRRSENVSESEAAEDNSKHEEVLSREGDAEVSVTTTLKPTTSEDSKESRGVAFVNPFSPRAGAALAAKKADDEDEDDDEEWEDDDDDDDDEEDDLDDEEDDLDDEEDEEEDDLEEDEWEEVEDDDEEDELEEEDDEEDDEEDWDEEEEDDEDWDDDEEDDDDDFDDEDEEEEAEGP